MYYDELVWPMNNKLAIDPCNISSLRALLERHNFTFKKSLGQNFLTCPQTADKIITALQPDAQTHVIECGSGAGALSARLMNATPHVTAIDIDKRVFLLLEDVAPGAKIIHCDMLKVDFTALISQSNRTVAVANLPYYITSEAILKLLSAPFERIVIMIQKEVVARLVAQPGDEALTAFSILVQLQADVKHLFNVGRHCFTPQPNVDSAVVMLTPYAIQPQLELLQLVKNGYANRRKTLVNNLQSYGREKVVAALAGCNINACARAETLTIDDWRQLEAALL